MIAYNAALLDNLEIRRRARIAMRRNLISQEEYSAILLACPVALYTPNLFIRIGAFLLTAIIVSMSFGFFTLLTSISTSAGFGVLSFFFSASAYAALEFVVRRNHYRSGLDDAFLWSAIGCMITAINLLFPHLSYLGQAILIFILTAYATLRFANTLTGGIALLSFLAIMFYSLIPFGNITKAAMPFVLMSASFMAYLAIAKNRDDFRFRHYRSCFILCGTLALFTIYAAMNFFVVREVSNEMFGLHLREGASIPGGWIFWCITILIPPVYLVMGIRRKDSILLRNGLVLLAATAVTIRHYYPIAPLEVSMTIGGCLLIAAAYLTTKYLQTPKRGITDKASDDRALPGLLQLEALAIAQAFHQSPGHATNGGVEFGGGSGGGGGATGSY